MYVRNREHMRPTRHEERAPLVTLHTCTCTDLLFQQPRPGNHDNRVVNIGFKVPSDKENKRLD